jgi:hypothetical protein
VVGIVAGMPAAITLAAVSGMMIVPISGAYDIDSTRGQKVLSVYAGVMGAIGLLAVAAALVSPGLLVIPGALFVLGFLGFGWVANVYALR